MFPFRDHNPSDRTPWVTWSLIAANVAIYLLYATQLGGDARLLGAFFGEYGLVPARVTAGEGYVTVLTSMFLHAGLLHLGGNMLFLWVFGDNMEDAFGHLGFLAFYLVAGVAAALTQFAMNPGSVVPMVGASGAVAGVLGGYLLLFPRARVDVLVIIVIIIRVIALPAWIVLGLWFALQIAGTAAAADSEGGVAFAAHAGGFVAGLAAHPASLAAARRPGLLAPHPRPSAASRDPRDPAPEPDPPGRRRRE
jgi:membrane associated rhomboid family serine protease